MEKIRVVDDPPMVRKFNEYTLSSMGYQAEDGDLPLEMLLSAGSGDRFELALTDMNKPRIDDVTFIAEMRDTPDYAETPIIIVTTQEQEWDAGEALRLGANLYFSKPADPEKLVHSVANLLKCAGKKGERSHEVSNFSG